MRYGGVWTRMIVAALDQLRDRVPSLLLASAVFSILRDPVDHPNCLIVVRSAEATEVPLQESAIQPVDHEYVYRAIVERPAPSCFVISASRDVMFLGPNQPPVRSEVTARHSIAVSGESGGGGRYELLLGTMAPPSISTLDTDTSAFVARTVDIVLRTFEVFARSQLASSLETAIAPQPGSADDLQPWLIAQLLEAMYPGSLCEINETSGTGLDAQLLASSVAKPWEPSPWDPPKGLEMLSGYASQVGIPLLVEHVMHPWTTVIDSVESQIRYLESRAPNGASAEGFSAVALPVMSGSGVSVGSIYILMPRTEPSGLRIEVRVLSLFGRIVRETIERRRAAIHSATVSQSIAVPSLLTRDDFKVALLELLHGAADTARSTGNSRRDVRLPILLLSAHGPEPGAPDPAMSDHLRNWLVETLGHLDCRSLVRAHWAGASDRDTDESFAGEFPGVGMLIALSRLVPKDELDRIRSSFPKTINRISPTNAPVRLFVWVLDVSVQRVLDAARGSSQRSPTTWSDGPMTSPRLWKTLHRVGTTPTSAANGRKLSERSEKPSPRKEPAPTPICADSPPNARSRWALGRAPSSTHARRSRSVPGNPVAASSERFACRVTPTSAWASR